MDIPTEQPPRGTKRPPVAGDVYKASGARRYDFVDDDDEERGGGVGGCNSFTGFLDENGTFVERAARGGAARRRTPGWAPPTPTRRPRSPAATKRARKALRRLEEDERLVDDLVAFEIRKRMVGILEPGETVPRALRGLGGRMDGATRRAFDELTDAAAELFDRGDLDAYSHDLEAFEEAAWPYEYRRCARAAAYAAAQEVQEGCVADPTAAATATTRDYVDAGAETAADVDAGGQAVNPGQRGTLRDAYASGTVTVEAGDGAGVEGWDYVYDPASGYYYSSSTGFLYDAASGC